MRYWTGAVIAFALAVVQASSVEQFKILGVSPNLMLVFLVAWLVVRGLDDVLPMMLVAGVTLGLIGLQSPGVVLLALVPIAGLGVLRELHLIHSELVLVLLIVFVGTVAFESVILLATMATGGVLDVGMAVEAVIIPAALVNVALAPIVYALMRMSRPKERLGLSF